MKRRYEHATDGRIIERVIPETDADMAELERRILAGEVEHAPSFGDRAMTSLRALIHAAPWRPTTYISPHEYLVKPQAPTLYRLLAEAIAARGSLETFQGRRYRYLTLEGYRYWCLPPVMNRAVLSVPQEERSSEREGTEL